MQPLRLGGGSTYGSDEGSLDVYLRDIARYPLITRADEADLARRIRDGDQEALDTLIRSNLRFVVSVAKKYQHQGVSLADLINEGNLGLIRAAHRFDETKEIKFISYAVWWIRQSILQALADQSRIVRVPLNRAGEMHRIGRRTSALQQELGRDPTAGEIAEGMDLDVVEVERTLAISRAHVSLDAPTVAGDDAQLLDHIADTHDRGADAETIDHARTECIEAVLGSLREREARIVRLYFGLGSGDSCTLEEIGAMMGITRERVRQIKDKALMRMRLASEEAELDSFLG
jgi:RNA polymerase primary sigma factor